MEGTVFVCIVLEEKASVEKLKTKIETDIQCIQLHVEIESELNTENQKSGLKIHFLRFGDKFDGYI